VYGNAQTFKVENFDLADMAKASGFVNQKKMKVAMIELVDFNTEMNEHNPEFYAYSAAGHEDYPFKRSLSGVLNSQVMPYTYEHRKNWALGVGSVSGAVALLAKVL
jgi:hypothetical protein